MTRTTPSYLVRIQRNIITVITLLVVLGGIGVGFMKNRLGLILSAAAGAIGVLTTLVLKFVIDDEIAKQGKKMLEADYGAGFYLSLILFIAAAGFNLYQMMNQGKPIPLIPSNIGGRGGRRFQILLPVRKQELSQ
ncbi:MAG: hypothetical protein HPY81_01200 [Firmicutes bacterium]|nr:hypothetical protein [Bacillota bacterium]